MKFRQTLYGVEHDNINYFGIKNTSIEDQRSQVTVLYYDSSDNFAIFLKEEGKDNPYFAGKISDITKFQ